MYDLYFTHFPVVGRLIETCMSNFADQAFVEFVIKSIVDNPDAVQVTRTVDEMGVLMTVDTDPKDVGAVVGRQGQTIKAVRLLAKILGAKNKSRVNIKLNQPDRPVKREVVADDDLDLDI